MLYLGNEKINPIYLKKTIITEPSIFNIGDITQEDKSSDTNFLQCTGQSVSVPNYKTFFDKYKSGKSSLSDNPYVYDFYNTPLIGMEYGNNIWVGAYSYNGGTIITSSDGLTWSYKGKPFGVYEKIFSIIYANEKFLIGSVNDIAISEDGENWSRSYQLTTGIAPSIYALTYSNDGIEDYYVGAGTFGEIYISKISNIEWTKKSNPMSNSNIDIKCLVYGNNLTIAAGDSGKLITSTDLNTWTERTSGFDSTVSINCLAYGNGIYIAVASNGKLSISNDGINWSVISVSFESTPLNYLTYKNNLFLGVGKNGIVAISENGIVWSTKLTQGDQKTICYGQNKFIIGGSSPKLFAFSEDISLPKYSTPYYIKVKEEG